MTDRWRILEGDANEVLQGLPEDSVHCCVTSPPYWGLRDYEHEDQVGLEDSLEEYVANLVRVFREVRRVLRPDGTVWLNLGDNYAGSWGGQSDPTDLNQRVTDFRPEKNKARHPPNGLKRKDLMFVPERVALALQEDGWWVRNRITWAKTNPKPRGVKDRFTETTEAIFLLAPNAHYYFDSIPVREKAKSKNGSGNTQRTPNRTPRPDQRQRGSVPWDATPTRHPRDVWEGPTDQYPDTHFATFPEWLPKRCILAATSARGACPDCESPWRRITEKQANGRTRTDGSPRHVPGHERVNRNPWRLDVEYRTVGWEPTCDHDADPVPCTVLDPFLGSGTTLAVAKQLGRDGIGIDLNPEYCDLARERIQDANVGLPQMELTEFQDTVEVGS